MPDDKIKPELAELHSLFQEVRLTNVRSFGLKVNVHERWIKTLERVYHSLDKALAEKDTAIQDLEALAEPAKVAQEIKASKKR